MDFDFPDVPEQREIGKGEGYSSNQFRYPEVVHFL